MIATMVPGCPRCGDSPSVGVLCAACAGAITPRDGFLPDHVRATRERTDAAGWLVDGFGVAHPIGVNATVGRGPTGDLVVLDGSVSRDHAELTRGEGGWQLRDLGSRNGTQLDGQRVNGRALLPRRALVRFGDIAFVFIGDAVSLPDPGIRSIATGHAAGDAVFRYTMRGEHVELCLVGAREHRLGALNLRRADVGRIVHDLALQIGFIHPVKVDDAQCAHPGCGQVQQGG